MVAGNSLTRSACWFFWGVRELGRGRALCGFVWMCFYSTGTTESFRLIYKLQVPRSCGIRQRMMKLVKGQN